MAETKPINPHIVCPRHREPLADAEAAHNVLTVEKDRIGRRVCQLSESRMQDVCAAPGFALGCDS